MSSQKKSKKNKITKKILKKTSTKGLKKKITKKTIKKKELKKKVSKKITKKKVSKKKITKKTIKKKQSKKPSVKLSAIEIKKRATERKSLREDKNKLLFYRQELERIKIKENEEKAIIKSMEDRSYCKIENCDFPIAVNEYCRLHYLGHWDYILQKERLLKNAILEAKIQTFINDYSLAVLEFILKDLISEKNFSIVVKGFLDEEIKAENDDMFLYDE